MNGTHAIYRNRALAQSLSVIIELNRMVVVLSAAVLIAGNLEANNLTISNTSLTGQNVSAGANHPDNYTMVQFDLSWENSWRHGTSPSGMVEALFIRTGGSGYTDGTHTISFSGGGATTDATASVTVSGGIITSINSFTQGAGYTSPPTAFTGAGPGSGAVFDPHIHPWWDAAWVFVKFRVSQNYVSAPGATNSGSTVTVGSTEGLRPGMVLRVTSGTGAFANGTVVSSVTSATTFVASSAPSAALASSAVVTGYPVWEHALFHENGHQAPSGSSISTGLVSPGTAFHATTNPGVGVFIHRENPGTGTFTANGTQLRWNYGANGLKDDDLVDFKIFGIEMVYVPECAFYIGSGGTELGSLTDGAYTGDRVVSVSVTNQGSGYGSVPSITFTGGGGSAATATGVVSDGKVTAINVVNGGRGYTFNPTVEISGGGGTGATATASRGPQNTLPLLIANENELNIGQNPGNLWGNRSSGKERIGSPGSLGDKYPKGYAAIYCMKYEMTQNQYVDFLNNLSRLQQDGRTATSLSQGTTSITGIYVMNGSASVLYRNGIRCDATISANDAITFYCDLDGDGIGDEENDGQSLAVNYLSWYDHTAYLDWSGLRPMTELEYEKLCRGPMPSVPNELAWGTSQHRGTPVYTLSNSGQVIENVTNYETGQGIGNLVSVNTSNFGPFRVGLFAAHASNTGRVSSGASYYGIMELTGNQWEYPVVVSLPEGRQYEGQHGDGTLSVTGFANAEKWPSTQSGSTVLGAGIRGGTFQTDNGWFRVCQRRSVIDGPSDRPFWGGGGRGVRTAP